MSSADYRAVAEHFDRLLDMDLDERRVYLADLRRSAPHLALAVERLLEHDSEPEGPLERMVLDDSATGASASASAPHDDDPIRIGKYSVVRRLGRGGMGVVFECEQEQPRRRVAIKVLHAALTTPGLRRRFVREAELLARVQHDGIAHVYEAGDADIVYADTSTTRQPFLAMEFVDGMELVDHAMHHGLDLKARLRLIASVCDAVEAAHRSGVVHRDLKPSNILVTADGKPKVLDFGIARESANHEATLVTEPGQILGTLAYMSPEQILGQSDEVGPRSDVYALGVIGYELLAGVLPKDVRRLSIVEAARVVTKEDATRLGLRSPALAGDIETVIEKALEKAPARRYASAGEVADELRRILANEPIHARAASRLYRAKKFVRRHKALVVATTTTIAALVALVIGVTIFGLRAADDRDETRLALDRARLETRKAEDVRAFLDRLLSAANPDISKGRPITVAELVDGASRELELRPPADPEVEVAIRRTLANTYRSLARYDDATEQLARCIEIDRRIFGAAGRETLVDRLRLARIHCEIDRVDQAKAELEELAARFEAFGESGRPELAEVWLQHSSLATSQRRFEEAVAFARRALATLDAPPASQRLRASILSALAFALVWQRDFDAARGHYEEALAIRRAVDGEPSTSVIETLSNLANLEEGCERYEAAAHLNQIAVAFSRRLFGPRDPRLALVLFRQGGVLNRLERFEEARLALEECLEIANAADFALPSVRADMRWTLAHCLEKLSLDDAALVQLREADALLVASTREDRDAALAFVRYRLALLLRERDPSGAEAAARSSIVLHEKLYGSAHPGSQAMKKLLREVGADK